MKALKNLSMKYYKLILYSFLLILFACEKDEALLTLNSEGTPAVITNTSADLNISVTEENLSLEKVIAWDKTKYGINTEVNYTIEIDLACNNFANPKTLASTTNSSIPVTIESLNSKVLNDLKLSQHLPSDVSIRVTSKIKNQYVRTSEPVTFTITPWNAWAKGLWLISEDWNDDAAPGIYESGTSAHDGYVFLNSAHSFRFADKRTCDKTLFGGNTGQLTVGSTEEIAVANSGYYRIK